MSVTYIYLISTCSHYLNILDSEQGSEIEDKETGENFAIKLQYCNISLSFSFFFEYIKIIYEVQFTHREVHVAWCTVNSDSCTQDYNPITVEREKSSLLHRNPISTSLLLSPAPLIPDTNNSWYLFYPHIYAFFVVSH